MAFDIGFSLGDMDLFGSKKASEDRARRANRSASRRDREFQREVLKKQIQWRTQDAQKAGLHPLFAMGGSVATGSPTAIGASTSPSSGSGITASFSKGEKRLQEAQINLLEAQTLEAMARANGMTNGSGGPSNHLPEDIIQQPAEVIAHPSHKSTRDFTNVDGVVEKGLIPAGTPASVLEDDLGEIGAAILQMPRVMRALQNLQRLPDSTTNKSLRAVDKAIDEVKEYSKAQKAKTKAALRTIFSRTYTNNFRPPSWAAKRTTNPHTR